jgi:hypothetical protein
VARFGVFDVWFRPKGFESERLYERLGALLIKRYVPTGGDLVMQRLRRHHPGRRWVASSLQSLCRYERKICLNESIHLIGFMGFTALAASKFASGFAHCIRANGSPNCEPDPRTVASCSPEI